MTVLNAKLGTYQMQEGNTDSQGPEEMCLEGMGPLPLQASPPASVQNSPPRITMW